MMDSPHWFQVAFFKTQAGIPALQQELENRGVAHRFLPQNEGILLEIRDHQQVAEVQALIKNMQRIAREGHGATVLHGSPFDYPMVLTCILLSCLGALLVSYKFDWVHWFSFQNFLDVRAERIFFPLDKSLQKGEYWRLVSPMFLHFGLFHVVFNSLWLWELGRRVEKHGGSIQFLAIVLITGFVSNYAQYRFGGPGLFGGMSGVVYGLLGYIWIYNRVSPHILFKLTPGLIPLLVGFLLVCLTGIIDLLIPGQVANAAHVGGLLSGMLLGLVMGSLERRKPGPVV